MRRAPRRSRRTTTVSPRRSAPSSPCFHSGNCSLPAMLRRPSTSICASAFSIVAPSRGASSGKRHLHQHDVAHTGVPSGRRTTWTITAFWQVGLVGHGFDEIACTLPAPTPSTLAHGRVHRRGLALRRLTLWQEARLCTWRRVQALQARRSRGVASQMRHSGVCSPTRAIRRLSTLRHRLSPSI